MNKHYISICIPSYNRPREIMRLLNSIDCDPDVGIQIVVCEDDAPKRTEVRETVQSFSRETRYDVRYIENEYNKGYDANIRSFITYADGEYVVLMGEDDVFIPNKLDKLIHFLKDHADLGYVLRSYRNIYKNGSSENYRYYNKTTFFSPSEDTYVELFRKSVFVSGFTFKRELALETMTDQFDGTLLYQLYIQAEICLKYNSAYFDVPLTEAYEGGDFYFGSSKSEQGLYVPNKHTVSGETKFIASFFQISRFMDAKYKLTSTEKILRDMSKYSFPMLALVSENGKSDLRVYYKELKKLGLDSTPYFTIYYLALLVAGPIVCRNLIRLIKKLYGKTPAL